jgi:hypothetical protein
MFGIPKPRYVFMHVARVRVMRVVRLVDGQGGENGVLYEVVHCVVRPIVLVLRERLLPVQASSWHAKEFDRKVLRIRGYGLEFLLPVLIPKLHFPKTI